jgi:hypothetical protein
MASVLLQSFASICLLAIAWYAKMISSSLARLMAFIDARDVERRKERADDGKARAATSAVEKFSAQQAKRGAPVSPAAPVDRADDDEITHALVMPLPQYAPRRPAPLADPDLIGSEGAAEEAAARKLGPEDETPPRGSRASRSIPVYRPEPTNEGGPA